MSEFFTPLLDWFALNPQWLGLGVFLITLVECMALIGVIWPGVVLLFSAALLAGQAGMSLWLLALLAWLAAFAGNAGSYLLGTRLQSGARSLPLLRSHPQWLAQAEVHLAGYGAASLLIGHFIGPLRPVLPLLAGMLRMPRTRFLAINLLAAGIWSFSAVLPGWLTGSALGSTPPENFWLQAALVAAGFIALAAAGLWLGKTRHPRRLPLFTLASTLLLTALLLGWPLLEELDLYLQQIALQLRGPALDKLMLIVTHFGDVKLQTMLDALLCALLLLFRARMALYFAVLALLGSTLLNAILKVLVGRIRPDLLPDVLSGYSMPSGHSVRSFCFFLVVAILLGLGRTRGVRTLLLAVACIPAAMVAFSRVYLTAHWPTDVLAGALLAITSCALARLLLQPRWESVPLGSRFWTWQASGSLLLFVLFVFWRFAHTAAKYHLS